MMNGEPCLPLTVRKAVAAPVLADATLGEFSSGEAHRVEDRQVLVVRFVKNRLQDMKRGAPAHLRQDRHRPFAPASVVIIAERTHEWLIGPSLGDVEQHVRQDISVRDEASQLDLGRGV
jgi:hypothetical protein